MNPGGIRADLGVQPDQWRRTTRRGDVRRGFHSPAVQQPGRDRGPTGAQIKTVLEQQFYNAALTATRVNVILQPSAGFTYSWDSTQPCGSKTSSLMLNSVPIGASTTYRVTMNNFLADGGDGFPEFTNGTNRVTRGFDVDAFADYLGAHAPVAPGPRDRITKIA